MINFKLCHSSNYEKGRAGKIEYIVIHYTANDGDTALGNASYFARARVGASAHYFVDEKEVWQSVQDVDTAWHCGGSLQGSSGHTFHGKCKNYNSLGIEMCSAKTKGEFYIQAATQDRTIELVRHLMTKYNIPITRVIRHYDVTGKLCPRPFVDEVKWAEFKERIGESDMTEAEVKKTLDGSRDKPSPWADKAVKWAVEKGIISDGKKLDGVIDKEELVTILYRALAEGKGM